MSPGFTSCILLLDKCFVCNSCAHECSVCGSTNTETYATITTHDHAMLARREVRCASCCICSYCGSSLANRRYAYTSHKMWCMPCHRSRTGEGQEGYQQDRMTVQPRRDPQAQQQHRVVRAKARKQSHVEHYVGDKQNASPPCHICGTSIVRTTDVGSMDSYCRSCYGKVQVYLAASAQET
jgi:hypothetical protein